MFIKLMTTLLTILPLTLASTETILPIGIFGIGPLPELQLYSNLGDLEQFSAGYGGINERGHLERIDQVPVQLPEIDVVQPGVEQVIEKQFPEDHREHRVENTKEIHSYTNQDRVTTINNRNVYRYVKNLLVNTQYNTNIQKINHAKVNNLVVTNLQETHQPKLLVKYTRVDTVAQLPDVNTPAVVDNQRKDNVLPPVVLPAVAEKIGYNGLPLGNAIPIDAGAPPALSGRAFF